MSAGSPLKHLSKQSESKDLPQDLAAQTTPWLTRKERSPMNIYRCVSGTILQDDVQDDIPRSESDVGGSSPPSLWRSSAEGCISPDGAPGHGPLQDPGANPLPLERTFSPQSANEASDWCSLQQTSGKELASPPKPEDCGQSESACAHQSAGSLFLESSEGMLVDSGAYVLTQKTDAFAPLRTKPQTAIANPNAFFKAACDSIARLRTSFDHYINEKMEALGRLAPALLWMDTRSSPGALEAVETVQATAASCDYIVKFLNWSPTRLSVGRGQWRARPRGASRVRGRWPARQRKGQLLKPEKFCRRAFLKFLGAKVGKSGPKRKRVCLKASQSSRKALKAK